MPPLDAIVCDIDGCLGPESTAPLDAPALARIADYNAAAIARRDRPVLTLCTGRPQPFAECLCRLLNNTVYPVIAEMGVWLFDPRDNAYLLDPAITPDHVAAVHDAQAWIAATYGPRGVVIQPGKAASISLWHRDTAYLMSLRPELAAAFDRRGWPLRVSNSVAWINCDLAHVSKGTGVGRFLAATGLPRERVGGIGDTMGDIAIRDAVAWFACPSNATADIKARADYVSPHPEVRGVLDILDRFT